MTLENVPIPVQGPSGRPHGQLPVRQDGDDAALFRGLAEEGVRRHGDSSAVPFRLTDEAWASIEQLLGKASAGATTRAYATARRLFVGWWLLTYARPFALPVPPEALAQFIADFTHNEVRPPSPDASWVDAQLVKAKLKKNKGPIRYNTLKQRVAAIARWHVDADLPSPFAQPLVRRTLQAAKRAASEEGTLDPRRRSGVQKEALKAVLATCNQAHPAGIRDRALLLFAWSSGGRRPSEVAEADLRNLQETESGYTYLLRKSKTQKPGDAPKRLPIVGSAAAAMREWLVLRDRIDHDHANEVAKRVRREGLRRGQPPVEAEAIAEKAKQDALDKASPAIFRSFRGKKARVSMTAEAVGDVIARRCRESEMDGNFGGHSMRRGWVTQAWNDKLNPADIMAMSLHTSLASLMVYNEAAKPEQNPAASLLDM